ncbi:Uncharacterised protein [Mycobacteroides abscessus subsp. massiliense]|uniref:hypothetical protein n=1 Tax=Mycobacteroides abscessus TaxID=36809 RepID=UPI0009D459A7|nr:hypothetical protein [Mycobacteroides abscessus]SKU49663.1 Uncharacterised protein [Mycobacteroides abscessus subsp. massiliense]SKV03459.1 Uncharacterised protein [Mycobacteroides abscessus subsp. massiliense]
MADYDRAEFIAWLTSSCERQGVPLKISDPAVINQVAVLLGQPVARLERHRPPSMTA